MCWSHNNEHQPVPLLGALAAGCIAIEPDCRLHDGLLYTAHDANEIRPLWTLSNIYLDPLFEILTQQNAARGNPTPKIGVYDEKPEQSLHLTIDFKSVPCGHDGIPLLLDLLEPFRQAGFLTYYDQLTEKMHPGPLTIVGTGDADFSLTTNPPNGRIEIFKDARFFNFLPEQNPTNSLYCSAKLLKSVGWFTVKGGLSKRQIATVRRECKAVRDRGLIPRYWGTPDDEGWWRLLVESGVFCLNADDLERGARWLRGCIVDGIGIGARYKEGEEYDEVEESRGCEVL
ncbi:Altered inheritance of mitochondria 6 protein [Rutstroemia sp. NJR-2017a BBW]|nr:Altered inheritance of mitochondria 6 protein [Rutstroemia sp. NJR-2017a BBW]